MTEVCIRADGNNQIGLGHLIRSFALAEMLREQFRIRFYCKSIPTSIRSQMENTSIRVQMIKSESDFIQHIQSGQIVVLDGYQFDADYQKSIVNRGNLLVCIDDMFSQHFYAHLIINHAPGITKNRYKSEAYSRFALGPEYALLRPEFINLAQSNSNVRNEDTILICFGGSDVKNLTITALNVVLDFNQFKKITIITGSSYRHSEELYRVTNNEKRVDYYHDLPSKDVAELIGKAGSAIVPSSGILFEVIAGDAIPLSGIYNDNQTSVYAGFKKMDAFIDAGAFSSIEIENAIIKIPNFKTKRIIDGKSPSRIRDLFTSIYSELN
jgi:UDP-2,4-diacetamido-2,4,6-trideoxy-beta-L-altropyranose hydrolase